MASGATDSDEVLVEDETEEDVIGTDVAFDADVAVEEGRDVELLVDDVVVVWEVGVDPWLESR